MPKFSVQAAIIVKATVEAESAIEASEEFKAKLNVKDATSVQLVVQRVLDESEYEPPSELIL